MAGQLGELFVKIRADTSEFNRNIDASERQTKQFTVASAAALAGFAIAAVAAFRQINNALRSSIQAYGRQIDAEQSLRAALAATGEDVQRLFPLYQDLASEIQELTTVGDEAALEMITLAQNMGVVEDQMEDVVKGAIGLSDAFGIGTQQALRGITNALQGNFEQLQRYIPALRTAESEAEKLAIVQQAMANGFEISQARAQTAFGAIQQYQNAVGDLQEQLGQTVAEGMEPFVRVLTGFVQRTTDAIGKTREFRDIIDALREGDTLEDFGVDQLRTALVQARAELVAFEENYGRLTGRARETGEVRLQQLQEQVRALERAVENERTRAQILERYSATSREYQEFLNRQEEAAERTRDVLLEIEELRRSRLTAEERELEDIQLRINLLIEERDAIELTTRAQREQYSALQQLIDDLAGRRAELREQIRGEVEDTDDLTDAIEHQFATLESLGLQVSGVMASGFAELNDELEELNERFIMIANMYADAVAPVLEGFGEALAGAKDGWVELGQTAVRAIAQIIRGYARLWAAESIAFFARGNIPRGSAMAAAAAGGYIAAGVVEGLASQIKSAALGTDFETQGPQLLMVGDNPGGRERVTVEPLSSPNLDGPNENIHVQINLDGREISKFVTRGTRNGRILVDQRAVV